MKVSERNQKRLNRAAARAAERRCLEERARHKDEQFARAMEWYDKQMVAYLKAVAEQAVYRAARNARGLPAIAGYMLGVFPPRKPYRSFPNTWFKLL